MTAHAIDPGYLLEQFHAPTIIRSEAQNEHYTAVLERLESNKTLRPDERRLAELLTLLITDFERKRYPLKPATPIEVIEELMRANDLRQKDLVDVFGSESIVSEVLHGKRELNKEHIRRLCKRFHVSPELFF